MTLKDKIKEYYKGALAVLAAGAVVYSLEASGITPVQRDHIRARAEATRQYYSNSYGDFAAWTEKNIGAPIAGITLDGAVGGIAGVLVFGALQSLEEKRRTRKFKRNSGRILS